MKSALRLGIVPLFLALCLLLGGASAGGFWENMALQLIAVAILFGALIIRRGAPTSAPGRRLIALAGAIALLGLFQLVPLPPSLWSALPGRDGVARAFALMDLPLPWMPVSLDPAATIASLLWLLPAAAVMLGTVRLGSFKPVWIAWVVAAIASLSVVLGALQLAGGAGSPWYFYRITNAGATTGFFANSNHMATLLVAAIPFLAALYLHARRKRRSAQHATALLVMVGGAIAVVAVGIVINTSLAGLGLMVPALAASALMIRSRNRALPAWSGWAVGALLAASVAAIYLAPIGEGFRANNLTAAAAAADPESRATSLGITAKAAADHLPVGSGIGTFVNIYPAYEDPAAVDRRYMNHAHGDYHELLLETGLPGALLILLFLWWWGARSVAIWRAEDSDLFAMAATIASGVILAHSIVDYPLRTAAIAALFAACCALMAEPRARVGQREPERADKARHLSAD